MESVSWNLVYEVFVSIILSFIYSHYYISFSIVPLTATFMARGVGYAEDFPWQAEAALAALVFGGLSFKYVKEALTFEDSPISLDSSSD